MVDLGIQVGSPDTVETEYEHKKKADSCESAINGLIEIYFSEDEDIIDSYYTGKNLGELE